MSDMSVKEASQLSIALITAFEDDDLHSVLDICDDVDKEDFPAVVSALCGSVSVLMMAIGHATGADTGEVLKRVAAVVASRQDMTDSTTTQEGETGMQHIKISKEHDPTREKFGLTPNDLRAFVEECERVGVDMDEPCTGVSATLRLRLKKIEAGA